MLLVKTAVKRSNIEGLGCFAAEDIKEGQVVWVFDPRIDLRFKVSELGKFPPHVQQYIAHYGYTENSNGDRCMVLCGDNTRYVNHSDDPNLLEGPNGPNSDIAARDIKAGEELTCDYYNSDLDAEVKLADARPLEAELSRSNGNLRLPRR